MMGLNNLGTAVTVVIAVTLTALMVEILYFLWRRRRSYRPRSRVEPQEHSLPTSSPPSSSFIAERERELELEFELEQQVMKYQCHYGISRVLFTIKEEEEREGFDSESGECSAVKTVSLSEVVVVVNDDGNGDLLVNETTPFSTPCASPPYFTPHSSPFHDYYYNNNNVANNG
ncbi:uncharacterized protein LOC130959916 [Arachis stenosperma]|uniref:uncharacterized protein LOC130959916 n=1 Tax=Arachis stenosperma TaxID=217475 RepID=UPI0025AD9551|nr:uncharacterized protein LOC130959916 [Arachis stenosperma]